VKKKPALLMKQVPFVGKSLHTFNRAGTEGKDLEKADAYAFK
jgi:hypothetical protein